MLQCCHRQNVLRASNALCDNAIICAVSEAVDPLSETLYRPTCTYNVHPFKTSCTRTYIQHIKSIDATERLKMKSLERVGIDVDKAIERLEIGQHDPIL